MRKILFRILTCLVITSPLLNAEAPLVYEGKAGPGKGKHLVFIASDHEYRSEETLPALARILANPQRYRVVTEPGEIGRPIHRDIERSFELTTPGFCGACHDVTLPSGLRLEEAFSEFKHSPVTIGTKRATIATWDCVRGWPRATRKVRPDRRR